MAIRPYSLTQPVRTGQVPVGNGWRACFAPFNSVAAAASIFSQVGPTLLDLQNQGPFRSNGLPTGFYDLGWVDDVKVSPGTKMGMINTGYRNVVRKMYVGDLAETVEMTFKERSRMVDSISSGQQVFNLLSNPTFNGVITGPLTASGATAIAMGPSGYYATGFPGVSSTSGQAVLTVASGSGVNFPAGTYIVCDQDYNPANTSTYVGDNAARVSPGLVSDIDFIRKTSDYVARVVAVIPGIGGSGQDGLVLNAPFVGGGSSLILGAANYGPTNGAKVQAIKGYSRRNGGSAIKEWTCLLLMDFDDSSQMALYYPRLAASNVKGTVTTAIQNTHLNEVGMDTEFQALGFDDPTDGETVLSYMAYYPSSGQQIQI